MKEFDRSGRKKVMGLILLICLTSCAPITQPPADAPADVATQLPSAFVSTSQGTQHSSGVIASPTASPSPTRYPTRAPYCTLTPTSLPLSDGPINIGYSVARRPIQAYRFGTGSSKRLIVAGIHGGNERNTITLADELIGHIQDHLDIIPSNITLYIVRNLNPDGEARGSGIEGRLNDNGVDLNRNFPYRWQAKWPEYGCWNVLPVSAGEYPASEPETLALLQFISYHKFDALINYHSSALGIFAGGRPLYPDSVNLAEAVATVSDYSYPPTNTGCLYTGNLTDWAASQSIAAIDIELSNHQDTDFEQNLRILEVFLNWTASP